MRTEPHLPPRNEAGERAGVCPGSPPARAVSPVRAGTGPDHDGFFSDAASAMAAPLPASRRPSGLRTPLETLTWQAPPADGDAHDEEGYR
ncbi:hypothetical protein [Streptomyces sp. NPDC056672]|uniref:hypothetical protein n=1 Tax=Streptomyces sp. NPDC056672 TaxID=3345906 RepID=UPI0036780DCF